MENRGLYIFILVAIVGLILAATGSGLVGAERHWLNHWQHRAFRLLCHQNHMRSFWINGIPMSVCSRCYGIYFGFGLFWIAIPIMRLLFRIPITTGKNFLIVAILLNLIDIIGNMVGIWQNTLLSRFLLGTGIGGATVLFLADSFIKIEKRKKGYEFNETVKR